MSSSRRARYRRQQQSLRRHQLRIEGLEKRYALNAAPVLDVSASPALPSIAENTGVPVGQVGTFVSSLIDTGGTHNNFSDTDGDLPGIAITGVNLQGGMLWYSSDNGSTWLEIGAVSDEAPRLLAADGTTRVYFEPAPDFTGTVSDVISFKAWDRDVIWQQLAQDIDGEASGDRSGKSVSLSADGQTLAIGAWCNSVNGYRTGHVRIYSWDGSAWSQLGNDIDGQVSEDWSGWSVSLSADGQTVAIGAPEIVASGHVRIFSWNGSAWSQLGDDIDGEASRGSSGWSVSLSADGQTVAVGAIRNGGIGSDSGVRIYSWTGSTWSKLGADIDGEYISTNISVSLSADGQTVAIGATRTRQENINYSHVRIFSWDGSAWSQLGDDIDGEEIGDNTRSVSLSADGQTVAIGATNNDGNGNGDGAGHVRIYSWGGSAWSQLGDDIDGQVTSDHLGGSVSLSADGQTLAIGASGNSSKPGYVRIFGWTGSSWSQLGDDLVGEANGDYSGISVSLSSDGQTVAIGAEKNDGNGPESGHVRVFKLGPNSSQLSTETDTISVTIGSTNNPPSNVALTDAVNTILETADTSSAVRIAGIDVTDDELGSNVVNLSGPDASSFYYTAGFGGAFGGGFAQGGVYLNPGIELDAISKPSFQFTVEVSDTSLPGSDSVTVDHTLTVLAEPTVTVTDGDSEISVAGDIIEFTATYAQAVTAIGSIEPITITIDVGGTTRQANYVSGSGSNNLVFQYVIQNGEEDTNGIQITVPTINLNVGTIFDTATGDPALLTFTAPDTSAVLVDAASPVATGLSPPANGTYFTGDNLDFDVVFNEIVEVTGTPLLPLTIGSTTRNASYISGGGTNTLRFRYIIQSADRGGNGLVVRPQNITGTITDAAGHAAEVSSIPVPSITGVIVNAAVIQSVTASTDGSYIVGDVIRLTVGFNLPVDVMVMAPDTPEISLVIGSTVRSAIYESGSGTDTLVFEYAVQTSDVDTDGISINSRIERGGSLIQDFVGNPAEVTFVPPPTAGIRVIAVNVFEIDGSWTRGLSPPGTLSGSLSVRTDTGLVTDLNLLRTGGIEEGTGIITTIGGQPILSGGTPLPDTTYDTASITSQSMHDSSYHIYTAVRGDYQMVAYWDVPNNDPASFAGGPVSFSFTTGAQFATSNQGSGTLSLQPPPTNDDPSFHISPYPQGTAPNGHPLAASPEGNWLFRSGSGSGGTSYYPTTLDEVSHLTSHGYVTYSNAEHGWFQESGNPGSFLRSYETYIRSSVDQTISYEHGGNDSSALFIDDVFAGGAGNMQTVSGSLELTANVPVKLLLVGYDAIPGHNVWMKPVAANSLESISGIELSAVPFSTHPTIEDVVLSENATEHTLYLAGISAGGGESQPLRVTATSNNVSLIPDPTITYTSPNATGTLKFTPVSDQSGTATITVTVEDGGLDTNLETAGDNATVSLAFNVIVEATNNPPSNVTLTDAVNTILETADTSSAIRIAGIDVTDDELGSNVVNLSGPDASSFYYTAGFGGAFGGGFAQGGVYLNPSIELDAISKPSFQFTVEVSDTSLPDSDPFTVYHTLTVLNVNDVPTGSVTIAGTPREAEVLTASNTLADADGLGPISYQWKRDDVAISGATNSTYTLVQADVGSTITVTASYTDQGGTNESVTSAATTAVVDATGNQAPVLDPAASPQLDSVAENAGVPVGPVGTLVSSLIDTGGTHNNFSDADGDLPGIAITGVNLQGGTLYYSTDAGTTWSDVAAVSESSARVLFADANTRLAFTPAMNFNGSISDVVTFKAWDRTGGHANGEAGVATTPTIIGTFVDTSVIEGDSSIVHGATLSADGNTAYVSLAQDGVQIVNISDPATPSAVGSLIIEYPGNTRHSVEAVTLSADGNTLYSAGYVFTDGTFHVVDISDPANPSLTGSFNLPEGRINHKVVLSADGQTAYVATDRDGLLILNISDPTNPTLVGSFDTLGRTVDVTLSADENTAYVAVHAQSDRIPATDDNRGLQIINISTPAHPTPVGSFNTLGDANVVKLSADGQTAYVLESDPPGTRIEIDNNLKIINISDPANPTLTGTLDFEAAAQDVELSADESTAYVAGGMAGLRIINIRNRANPTLTGTLDFSYSNGIDLSPDGQTAYLSLGYEGGKTINLATEFSPAVDTVSVTVAPTNNPPSNVTLTDVVNTILETADTSSAIRIAGIDVTDDELGSNVVNLSGPDASSFYYTAGFGGAFGGGFAQGGVYLNPGIELDATSKPSFQFTVEVSDTSLPGSDPVTVDHTLTVLNVNDVPTGSVTIAGTPREAEVLTASNTLADADGLGAISYQWKRDDVAINGATNSTYTLVQADVGSTITVTASYTDQGGTNESVTSAATATVVSSVSTFTHSFDLRSGPDTSPHQVSNAQIYREVFSPNCYYWAPSSLNQWSEVIYKFDLPLIVDTVDRLPAMDIYNANASVNFDNAAEGFLDISADGVNWTTVYGSTSSQGVTQPNDPSTVLAGTDTIYLRARLFATRNFSVNNVEYAQFLRSVPEQGNFQTLEVSGSPIPSNSTPTGSVTITGTAREDEVLTASNTLADVDGLGPISYQWKRDAVAISGATNSTYTLVQADVGNTITVTASYTDQGGTNESVTSTETASVIASESALLSLDYLVLQANQAGSTVDIDDIVVRNLSTNTIEYSYDFNSGDLTDIQLLHTTDGTSAWEFDSSMTRIVNGKLRLESTGFNQNGSGGYNSRSRMAINRQLPPSFEIQFSVNKLQWAGHFFCGIVDASYDHSPVNDGNYQFLSRQAGGVAPVDNTPWVKVDGVLDQIRTGSTLSGLNGSDAEYRIVRQGTELSIYINSTRIGYASDLPDVSSSTNSTPIGSVTITGTAREDEVLTANNTLADADGLGVVSYQWKRDDVAISGATNSTYTLVQADVGTAITVTASYTDQGGTNESVTSAATTAVVNVNDLPTGSVTITGTAREDEVLTASNTLADEDGLGGIGYQWKRDAVAISGATNSTYTLVQADVGAAITVTASYTDQGGTNESVTSAATTVVVNVNDLPTGSVTITGTAREDEVLTASNTLADADGLGTISYQWKRDAVAISGATNSAYTLVQADVGAAITVTTSYTDQGGTNESVTSTATAEVLNVNDLPTIEVNGAFGRQFSGGSGTAPTGYPLEAIGEGNWLYSSGPSSTASTTFYPTNLGELSGCTDHGYVSYFAEPGDSTVGRFTPPDNSTGQYHLYETHVVSDFDQTVSYWLRGNDGVSLFVDDEFVIGGGFGIENTGDIVFQAGVPRKILLAGHNAFEKTNVTFRANGGRLEDAPGLRTSAVAWLVEDTTEQTVSLSGITAGDGEVQALSVTAASDNPGLIPDPTVTYTSPDTTGSIAFTPVADQSGTATLTITVTDGGLDNDLATTEDNGTTTRTIVVNVAPVNDLPTIEINGAFSIRENAPLRTLDLTAISGGGGESQPLRVTAVNDNTNLIPDLAVNYSTPDTTGSLTFTPTANQHGTATITVTIEDGGFDNDLQTSSDNEIFSRAISIVVAELNEAPALDPTALPAFDNVIEDAGAPSGPVGTLVDTLVDTGGTHDNFSDSNGDLPGIAITGANLQGGKLWYSTDNGSTWYDADAVSDFSALGLYANGSTRLYLEASANFSGSIRDAITFKAWDRSIGYSAGVANGSRLSLPGGLTGSVYTPGAAWAVAVAADGHHAFVADASSGLTILDVTDRTAPNVVSNVDTVGISMSLAISPDGTTAYISNSESRIDIFDISDLSNPVLLTSLAMPSRGLPTGIQVSNDGQHLFIADRSAGLIIANVTDRTSPFIESSSATAGGATGLTARNSIASIIDRSDKFYLFDISALSAPIQLSEIALPEEGHSVVINSTQTFAYVALDSLGLQVVDISDPTNPILGMLIPMPAGGEGARNIVLSSNETLAYVIDAASGVHVLDVSVPAHPYVIQTYETRGTANEVVITPDGQSLVIADGSGGVTTINLMQSVVSTASNKVSVNITPVNDIPTLDGIRTINFKESESNQAIRLTGITAGGGEFQVLRVIAQSNNVNLIPDPKVTFNRQNSYGFLNLRPLPDQYGRTTITVVVEDGGFDQNFDTPGDNATHSETFDVVVTPRKHDIPLPIVPRGEMFIHETLSGLPPASYQLPAVNVNGEAVNGLFNRITTTSSNTALIPDPTVIYASADVPSSLSFLPVADAHGTATLSLQVEDGGLDNNFATTGDNRQVTHQIKVNVLEVISNQGSAILAKDGTEKIYINTQPVTYQDQQAHTNIAGFAAIGATSDGGENALLVKRGPTTNRLVTDSSWRINGLFHSLQNESSPVLDTFRHEAPSTLNIAAVAGAYEINGVNNPTLIVRRGQTYTFKITAENHPLYLQTTDSGYQSANIYSREFTGNGQTSGEHQWVVPQDAPDEIFYQCEFHPVMVGKLVIID